MRYTTNYHLGSIEVGTPLSPLEDSRRMLTIDRQLFGLMRVLGNGVIQGWDVTGSGTLSVSITPGRGNVNFFAAETRDPRSLSELAPSTTNYIYAQAMDQTRFNMDVRFFSDTVLFNSGQSIPLATVVTSASSVLSIDQTIRTDISFIELIKELLSQHRHRGGTDNPSKINLESEVMGQLPGFRIDGIDASKLVSGRIPAGLIPQLRHSDLLDSGVLTHAQLDTFVRNLSNPNVGLLGEGAARNMLQLYMANKHVWSQVDQEADNLIVMVPGISPPTITDFVATTPGIVDPLARTISGIPSSAGQLLSTTFRTDADFENAFISSNIQASTSGGVDFFSLTKPFSQSVVDSFDNVFAANQSLPGWVVSTTASNSTTSFSSNGSTKDDGAFSAKFDIDQSFTIQATKFFSAAADWTNFNELQVSVETLSAAHGNVYFQILGGTLSSPTVISQFTLLSAHQVTSGFLRITQDLLSLTRNQVIGVRIFTDTTSGWDLSPITLNLDRIVLNNNLIYDPFGFIRFRLQTPQLSTWAGVSFDGDLHGGTIQFRARSAPNFSILDQTSTIQFGPYDPVSGDSPNVPDNVCFELEMSLTAGPGNTSTPVVRSVTVSYITSSTNSGITVASAADFLRGSRFSNVRVQSPSDVVIDGRIDVGDVTYGNSFSAQEVDSSGTPVLGITGSSLFVSPFQASLPNFVSRQPSMNGVATVLKQLDRTYLVTDANNDRVLLFDKVGGLINGLVSNNVRNLTSLYPLGCIYNRATSTVYVAWSTNLSFAGLDLTKFTIKGSGIVVGLGASDTVTKPQGQNTSLSTTNVTPIVLSTGHAAELNQFLDDTGVSDTRLFLQVGAKAATEGVDLTNENFASLAGPRGLPIFVGNVTYVVGIFRPISVAVTSAGTWLIGNAKPISTSSSGTDAATGVGKTEITSVVEMDPATGQTVFSDDSVDFSLTTLGAAVEYNSQYIAVAGIVSDSSNPTSSSSTTTPGSSGSATATPSLNADIAALSGYRGRVKIVEKSSGSVVFDQPTSDGTYAADVQVDADSNLVFIEKSFDPTTGAQKGRVVKMDEDGNVFFQYGLTELAAPNDVRVLSSGNLVVST